MRLKGTILLIFTKSLKSKKKKIEIQRSIGMKKTNLNAILSQKSIKEFLMRIRKVFTILKV